MHTLTGLGSWIVLLGTIASGLPAKAQVIPDDSVGTRVEQWGHQFEIEGGQRSADGANLIHSFASFGLETDQVANFVTTPEIQNVLGRVTGGEVSSIDGLIQVTGSSADLFLMNPAGIIFGEQARLDVAGDFTATTAEAIGFESGWLDAVGSVSWGDLTGDPVAFNFPGLESGAIVNFGDLAVHRGAHLNLFGGTVINGGTLSGGQVSLTAIGGGNTLQLSAAGNVLGLEIAADRVLGQGIAPIAPIAPIALPELLTGGEITPAGSLAIVDGVVTLSGAEIGAGDSVVTGVIDVSGETGGVVQVLGDRVLVAGATIDASGDRGGGAIYLGGEYRGGGTLPTAAFTVVDAGSWLDASAIASGDGGEVILWADHTAGFFGQILARGGAEGGNGGFVETSGAGSLVFRGGVDLAAPQGSLGSLLLDPTNITISSAASNPGTIESSPIDPFEILATDYDGQDVTIHSTFLQEITGNVTLEATNNITLTTNLTFEPGDGAIVLTADSDRDGTGTFNGINSVSGGRPQRFQITASGRDVTISGVGVTIGTIDTSTRESNTTSGSVNLRSYGTQSRITVDTINTSSVGENSRSGSVYLESDGRLEVSVTPTGQGINTSNTEVSSSSGSGSSSSPPSGSGSGSPPPSGSGSGSRPPSGSGYGSPPPSGSGSGSRPPSGSGSGSPPPSGSGSSSPPPSGSSSPSSAGDITLISRAIAPNSTLRAFNLDASSSSDNAQSGSITIQSNGGNLLLGQADTSSSGDNARSGDISIRSGGGQLSTQADRASGIGTGAHGKNGIGGSITLESEGGAIDAQVLDASSRGLSAQSGDVTIRSEGGRIESEYVSTATPDRELTQSGQITIDSRSSQSTPLAGSIEIEHLNTASASQAGQAGEIQVYGGAVDLGYILALSANQAGNVTIGSDDTITIGRLDAYGVLGASGTVTIGGLPDGSTADRIQIDRIESLSYNGATQGGVSITADGDITLSESIQTGASTGTQGSSTQIESLNGSITYQTIRTTVADARPINSNFTSGSGVISIVEEYAALANDTTLSRYFTNELDRLVAILGRIESDDFTAVTTPAPAGNLTLIAPNGTITARGHLDTYSQSGAAGQIAITSGSGLTLQNVTSYGNTASGDLTITSTGAIATANITTRATRGSSGNVVINGTSVASGNVSSIAGTGSGNIDITATDGTITTRNLSTTTTSGSSGNVSVSGTGNVTTDKITSRTDGDGDSGDITAESSTGSVTTGDVTTESTGGNSGNIDVSALIDIITGNLTSRAGQSSGDIALNAGQDINTGDITSAAIAGDSGNIDLTAGRDLTAGDITSSSVNGTSGDIRLDAGGNINTGDITTQDGQISLDAGGTIATGDLQSDNVALVNGAPLDLTPIAPEMAATQERNTAIATIQADSRLNPNLLTAIETTRPTQIPGTRSPGDLSHTQSSTAILAELSSNTLQTLNIQATDVSLDDIIEFDDRRTADYIEHFGGDGSLTGSVAATREAMANIEAQTGIRTGVVYISLRDTAIDLSVITAAGAPITISVPVDRTRLLDTVATYRNFLINARYHQTGRHNDYAAPLYDWLIRPIAPDLEALGVETLMFSLDAGLRGLPLAALHDGERYLIEHYSLSLIPSIGLIDTRYQPLDPQAPMLATGASQFATLSPLPAVPAELEALIHHRRQGEIFLNEDFTRQNIVSERRQTAYPIVHLATHAEFSAGDLSNSYIQLWDEHISLDDIRTLGWHDPAVELLVLSACRTALGNDEAEMGFAGLAVAAGVKTAIASLWSVDDTATFLLMTELYHHLSTAPIKAEALRAAQLALINGTVRIEDNQLYTDGVAEPIPLPESLWHLAGQNFSHPYYWSAFTAIGAPW